MPERIAARTSLGLSKISAKKARRQKVWSAGVEMLESRVLLSAGHHHHLTPTATDTGTAGSGGITPIKTTTTTTTGTGVSSSATPGSVTNPIPGDANSD